MAEAVKPFNIRSWPREGLTLEHAIEHAIRPLKSLYAAHTALEDLLRGRVRRLDYVLPDFQNAFERERQATIEPFRELAASGELVIAVRSFFDIGAPYRRLYSDEARELRILVGEDSLSLYLGKTRLHALIWAKDVAPQSNNMKGTEVPSSAEAIAPTSGKPVAKLDSKKLALKNVLKSVIDKIPFPPPEERQHGWKKKWAAAAAFAINERHKKEPREAKLTTRRSVENRMNEFALWPE
jgi:hypothetical protein